MPYLRINGQDIIRYIEVNGISLSENDLDAPKSGRTLDGIMHRRKVAQKNKAEIKLVSIRKSVLDHITSLLRNEYVNVETDMFAGNETLVMEMYNSSRKYGAAIIDEDGVIWYTGVSFDLIQR